MRIALRLTLVVETSEQHDPEAVAAAVYYQLSGFGQTALAVVDDDEVLVVDVDPEPDGLITF